MRRRSWRLLAALLAIFLLFFWAAGALAQESPPSPRQPRAGVPGESAGDGAVPGGPVVAVGNPLEWLVSKPLELIFWSLKELGVKTVYQLVFENKLASEQATERGIFTKEQWRVIEKFRGSFTAAAWVLLLFSVVVTGVRVALAGPDPRRRGRLMGMALDILVAVLLIEFMPLFFDMVCDLNAGLVETVRRSVDVGQLQKYLDPSRIQTGSAILGALAKIAWVTLELWFNMLYWVRLFVVGVLYVLSPLVAWSFSLHATKTPFFLAMSEIISNVFMQGAHAVVLGFWALIVQATPTLAQGPQYATLKDVYPTWWVYMGAMAIVIPVAGLVRSLVCGWMNLLGVKEEQIAGAATLGLGGLVGLGALVQSLGGVALARAAAPRTAAAVALSSGRGGIPPGWQPVSGFNPGGGGGTGGGGGGSAAPGPAAGFGGGGAVPLVGTGPASGSVPVGWQSVAYSAGSGVSGAARAGGAASAAGAAARASGAAAAAGGVGTALAGAAGRAAGAAVSHAAAFPVGAQPVGSASADVGEAAATAAASRLLARTRGQEGKDERSGEKREAAGRTAAGLLAAEGAFFGAGAQADGLDRYFHFHVPAYF